MAHSPNIRDHAGVANVKGLAPSDSAVSSLSIPALLTEEVQAWIERTRHAQPAVTTPMLMLELANAFGLANERQVYRYMSGETPFPLEKAVVFCRTVGSWRLLTWVNQAAGLLAEPRPDVGNLEGFDVVVEQSRNFREFSELAATYADAMDRPVSNRELQRIEKEGAEAIQQITRLIRIYQAMAAPVGAAGRRPAAKVAARRSEAQS